jgi:hypothetical protein
MDPMKGKIVSNPETILPSASKGSNKENKSIQQETKPKVVMTTIRFDGYVEAGSPMGIISCLGKSFSVSIGDPVGSGFEVESISSQRIKVRKGKVIKTILIGKETKI